MKKTRGIGLSYALSRGGIHQRMMFLFVCLKLMILKKDSEKGV
jgi:hypothetical protein